MKIQNRSKICLIISCAVMAVALLMTVFGYGINLGIDFEGGLSMEYSLKQKQQVMAKDERLQEVGYREY